MARLSDIIEEFIKELISENDNSELEIQRNELANQFSCAPSQINYVLTTRFTTEKGYFIESKRGGGGCIKIKRVQYKENKPLAQIINEKIGDNITYNTGIMIIETILDADIISIRESEIMKSAINDRTLSTNCENRNKIRADILKAMIIIILL